MREVALKIAWAYLGRPYIWGGDNPAGFDCSGLVIEALKSVGVLPRKGDWTAAGLFARFGEIDQAAARPGDLVFWDEPIAHVEMIAHVGPPTLAIGASGGGSWALDEGQAYRCGAFVKVRPIATRGGLMRFSNPYGD